MRISQDGLVIIMGLVLKVCVMCKKKTRIGKSKAKCKTCRATLSGSRVPEATRKPQKRHKCPRVKPFKGNYRDYIRSEQWKNKRQAALDFHGKRCNRCGSQCSYLLQVHHKHYRTLFNERMKDLEVLCDGCHRNEHEGKVSGVYDPLTTEFLKITKHL